MSFTDLDGDEHPENDTVIDEITVRYPPRHDVGATAILAPVGTLDSGTVIVPRAVIHNYGTRTETFPVTFRVGTVYDETVSRTLVMGQTDTVDFPSWTAEPVGQHATMAFTDLTGDENPSNDTVTGEVEVVYPERHDVGAMEILAPVGTLDSGTVVTPRAVIHNYGTRTETFPVTFTIDEVAAPMLRIGTRRVHRTVLSTKGGTDQVYSETVQRSLTPGETDTVDFPDWVAQPVGEYTTMAFTELTGDEHPENDTAYGADPVTVVYPERHDVGAMEILVPAGEVDSGTVITPRAVIHNYGTRTETFPITFDIGGFYVETVQRTLDMGQTDTVDFPDWVAQPVGIHQTMAFTGLTGDEHPENDTAYGAEPVTVVYPERHNVGAVEILAPLGSIYLGTTVTPRAVVHNYGTRDETFPVTFTIGGVYEQSLDLTLIPGETDTIDFPDWVANPFGLQATVCYTDLEGDENRTDDTATSTVTVELARDVGTRTILAPEGVADLAEGITETSVTPKAWVFNDGQQAETGIPVVFRIEDNDGIVYEESYTITTALAPGDSIEVTFPESVLGFGRYALTCWTTLTGDNNPENDTAIGTYAVTYNPDGPGDLKAVIYTRAGERIRSVEQHIETGDPMLLEWDGLNDRGNSVSPGIYLCVLRFDPDVGDTEQQDFKLLVTTTFTGMILTWR
jgi:hypothetical protein